MASVTRKRSVVVLETKLEVIRMLEDGKSQRSVYHNIIIQSYGHFTHTGTSRSHAARITEVLLYSRICRN